MVRQVPGLLTSKKFGAAALAAGLAFAGLRVGMTREEVGFVVSPLLLYIGAQGLADFGKERAKAENQHQEEPT